MYDTTSHTDNNHTRRLTWSRWWSLHSDVSGRKENCWYWYCQANGKSVFKQIIHSFTLHFFMNIFLWNNMQFHMVNTNDISAKTSSEITMFNHTFLFLQIKLSISFVRIVYGSKLRIVDSINHFWREKRCTCLTKTYQIHPFETPGCIQNEYCTNSSDNHR